MGMYYEFRKVESVAEAVLEQAEVLGSGLFLKVGVKLDEKKKRVYWIFVPTVGDVEIEKK